LADGELGITLSSDEQVHFVTLDGDSGAIPIQEDAPSDFFTIGFAEDGGDYAVSALAGADEAAIGAFFLGEDEQFVIAGFIERTVDTVAPTTGTAAFSGEYIGVLVGEEGQLLAENGTVGDALLNVDFGAGTVSGSVTNRTFVNVFTGEASGSDVVFGDITYADGTIDPDTGEFSGDASATITNGTEIANSLSGEFSGYLLGGEAEAAAGFSIMEFEVEGDSIGDFGLFAVAEQ